MSGTSRDPAGTTTRTETSTYGPKLNLRLNYNLLPKLNLDTGLTYERTFSDLSGSGEDVSTDFSRLRPYFLLSLRDPFLSAAVGYDRREETQRTSGAPTLTLTRDTYIANLHWRPTDLPSLQVSYTRADTRDDPRTSVDSVEDFLLFKSEYLYRGLRASYTGTYLRSDDRLRDTVSSQLSHEGRLVWDGTFLDGRVSLSTDNRVAHVTLDNLDQVPLSPLLGLSGLDDTPLDGPPLASAPALLDGDRTASAGINLGFPGPGGDFALRNVGLDFGTAVSVSRLDLWVDGWGPATLPADIATAFRWDIYTSRDNLTWTFHAAGSADFGPFDRRFAITFPTATARYVKAVTRPLPGGVIGATNTSEFPNIFVTELEAVAGGGAEAGSASTSLLLQNYNVDLKVLLLRSPSLYYRFNASYLRSESGAADAPPQTRYVISNGLLLNHRFNPVFSTSASASLEIGEEVDQTRTALLYYASLAATPLRTLTNSLVFSGVQEWLDRGTSSSNSLILYNTAQLYRGLDASLNLGASLRDDEFSTAPPSAAPGAAAAGPPFAGRGATRPRPSPTSLIEERPVTPAPVLLRQEADGIQRTSQREVYLNLGLDARPHPSTTFSLYYLGRLAHSSGTAGTRDTTGHRLDLNLSFTPFPALFLSAAVSVDSDTDRDTTLRQSYSLSWAPFPDGRLQISLSYLEDYRPGLSRIIQPTVRYYLGAARRSYLEAAYQYNTSEAEGFETEFHLFSAGLKIFF